MARPNFDNYMKDDLVEMARNDSPSFVEVPGTWTGIITWAIGRLGVGAIGFYAAYIIYTDMKVNQERVLSAYEKATLTQSEMRSTLEQHARILEKLERYMNQQSYNRAE